MKKQARANLVREQRRIEFSAAMMRQSEVIIIDRVIGLEFRGALEVL